MRSAREDFIAEELEYAAEHPEEFVGRRAIMEKSPERQAHDAEHIWHMWINRRQDAKPEGEAREHGLYEFKSMLQFLSYGHKQIRDAFEGKLSKTHQQCSHQLPVPILNNVLKCCIGTEVLGCPILQSLKDAFTQETNRVAPYNGQKNYALPDEQLYRLMANTCAWHIYTTKTGVVEGGWHGIDTSEGYLLDT
jgi:hypothetical protein